MLCSHKFRTDGRRMASLVEMFVVRIPSVLLVISILIWFRRGRIAMPPFFILGATMILALVLRIADFMASSRSSDIFFLALALPVLGLMFFCLFNLHNSKVGLPLFCIGLGCNVAVIVANGLRMPVLAGSSRIPHRYTPMKDGETNLNFLGDWIQFDFAVASPGDIVLYSGALLCFIEALICVWKTRQTRNTKRAP